MRKFMVIWIGQLVSMLGSGMVGFGLGVWIFRETGQATPFAMTVFLGTVPQVLLAPYAGVLADRFSRKAIMMLADTFTALVSLAVMGIMFLGELRISHVYFLAVAGSLGNTFQRPAYAASIPMMVPKEQLGRANGLNQTLQALTNLLPPLLGGFLFTIVGLRGLLLIDFVTFFAAIGTLAAVVIPMPVRDEPEDSKESIWTKMAYGFRYLGNYPGLVGMLITFSVVNFLLNFSAVVITPFVLTFADSSALGIVQMTGGLGMLLGGLAVGILGTPKRKMWAVYLALFVAAGGIALTGAFNSPITAAAGLFLLMAPLPLGSSSAGVIWQTKIPLEKQGRIAATRQAISQLLMPVAFLISGPLADRVFEPMARIPGRGMGTMFLISGGLLVVTILFAVLYTPLRTVETSIPDVVQDDVERATPDLEPDGADVT